MQPPIPAPNYSGALWLPPARFGHLRNPEESPPVALPLQSRGSAEPWKMVAGPRLFL